MKATPEEILDLCIERIRVGEHAEDILQQHPEVHRVG